MLLKNKIFFHGCLSLCGVFLYATAYPTRLSIGPLGPVSAIYGFFFITFSLINNKKKTFLIVILNYLLLYFLSLEWIASSLKLLTPIPLFLSHIITFLWVPLLVPQLWFPFVLKYLRNRPYLKQNPMAKNILIPSLIFVFLESLLSSNLEIFFGAPWIIYPHVAQKAALFGPKFFSFISYSLSLFLFEIFNRSPSAKESSGALNYFLFFFLLILPLGIPSSWYSQKTFTTQIKARIVQPNSSNELRKAAKEGMDEALAKIRQELVLFSTENMTQNQFDLIIWPEVAYPHQIRLNSSKTAVLGKLPSTIDEVIKRTQTPLLIGSYLQNTPAPGMTTQQEFNSAILFDTKGNPKEYYNKQVFIPFGEQIPLIGNLKFIQNYFPDTSFFAEGKKYSLFKGPKESNFITVMCFEVLFSSFIRTYLETTKKDHPSYIVNLTNDSWLLNSAGPKHHLFLSKWRALEFNLPIIRANNSGISTVIYPDSSLGPSLPFNQKGVLDIKFKVDKKRSPTLYQKYGHLPFLLFSFLLTLIYLLPTPKKIFTKRFKTGLQE